MLVVVVGTTVPAVGLLVASLVLEVPNPRNDNQVSNHETVSVDRPLYSSTVVGIVTTIGIGGGAAVNGGAGRSLFAMMISHGQSCSCTGR